MEILVPILTLSLSRIVVGVMLWIGSAVILTAGIYIVGKIFGYSGDVGFWYPFPKALVVTFFLSIISGIISFIKIPIITPLIVMGVWFIVIMKSFDMDFMEAIFLSLVLFFLRLFAGAALIGMFSSIFQTLLMRI